MKRWMQKTGALALTAALLCGSIITASAAGDAYYNRIKADTEPVEGYTVVMQDENGNAVQAAPEQVGDETMDVYKNVVKMDLTIEAPAADQQYVVMLLNGANNEVPTTNNIRYIDQNATGSFTIYPDDMSQPGLYNVLVTPSENETNVVFPFEVTEPDYMPGDADGSKTVNATDANVVLQHVVGLTTLEGANLQAADVDGNAGISASDANYILQYVVGLVTEIPKA